MAITAPEGLLGGKGSFWPGKRLLEPPAPVVWGRKPGEHNGCGRLIKQILTHSLLPIPTTVQG